MKQVHLRTLASFADKTAIKWKPINFCVNMKQILSFQKANSTSDCIGEMSLSDSTFLEEESGCSSVPVDTNVAILQTVICIVVLPIGIILIYGIVLYEHEGVDSQKRSLFNQLISAVFVALGLSTLICTIPITIRCWIGPLGHIFAIIVSFARRFFFTFFLVIDVEMLIYKIFCLIRPNLILRLDDYFWTAFLLPWNGIFSMVSSNADWYISSSNPRIYNFLSGNEDVISAGGDSYVCNFS